MKMPHYLSVLSVSAMVAILCISTGCKDSNQSKQVSSDVDKAGRMIVASGEKLPLTEGEVERASKGSGQEQLAKSVVDRIKSEAGVVSFDEAITDLTAMTEGLADVTDPMKVQQVCEQVLKVSQDFENQMDRVDAVSQKINDARIAKAMSTLDKAYREADDAKDKVYPKLMSGTLYLQEARRKRAIVTDAELDIQSILIAFSRAAVMCQRESSFLKQLETYRPDERIAELDKYQITMKEDLQKYILAVEHLEKNVAELEDKLADNRKMASQINSQYLTTLEEAEKAKGDTKYELTQKAYKLRSGTDDMPGSIHYEAQVEMQQNQLDILKKRLSYQTLLRDQTKESLESITGSIGELKTAPEHNSAVDKERELSIKAREQLEKEIITLVEQVNAIEAERVAIRDEVLDLYSKAEAALTEVPRLAKGDQIGSFARELKDTYIQNELISFWQGESFHNTSLATVLSLTSDIDVVGDQIFPAVTELRTKAEEAQAKADEIKASIEEEAAPAGGVEGGAAPAAGRGGRGR